MPTIEQLPVAESTSPTDEIPLAQGDVTRGVTLATLMGNLQPMIVLNGASLLGRTSAGPGGIELIATGAGLALSAGTLLATGEEQAGFAVQPVLSLGDNIILNSGGQPRQMSLPLLRGLFTAGPRVTIDPSGAIAAEVPTFSVGVGMPTIASGLDGDSYLDAGSGNVWSLASGAWLNTGVNILASEARARIAALDPLIVLRGSSVGTVPVQLSLDGTSATAATTLALPGARSLIRLSGVVTAQDLASGDGIVWDVAAALVRTATGGVPRLVGSASISVFASDVSMSSCGVAIGAGETGAVVEGVGLDGRAINWSATLLVVNGT